MLWSPHARGDKCVLTGKGGNDTDGIQLRGIVDGSSKSRWLFMAVLSLSLHVDLLLRLCPSCVQRRRDTSYGRELWLKGGRLRSGLPAVVKLVFVSG